MLTVGWVISGQVYCQIISFIMSFFGKLFGGKKEDDQPTTGEAIQKLRETEEMLIKKQDFLEKKIDEYMLLAKKNASKNKRGMLLCKKDLY